MLRAYTPSARGTCQKCSFPIEPAPPSRRECELSRAARPRSHCHVEDRVRSLMSNCVHCMHCTCRLVSGSRSRTGPHVSGRRSTECDIVLQGGLRGGASGAAAIASRIVLPNQSSPVNEALLAGLQPSASFDLVVKRIQAVFRRDFYGELVFTAGTNAATRRVCYAALIAVKATSDRLHRNQPWVFGFEVTLMSYSCNR